MVYGCYNFGQDTTLHCRRKRLPVCYHLVVLHKFNIFSSLFLIHTLLFIHRTLINYLQENYRKYEIQNTGKCDYEVLWLINQNWLKPVLKLNQNSVKYSTK